MFNLDALLDDYKTKYKKSESEFKGKPCTKFVLEHCIFDSSHTDKDACFFQYENGNIHYKCFHNSCSEYKWKDAKKKIAGEDELKKYWPKDVVNKETEVPKIEIISFAEIYDKQIDTKYIIDGFLKQGDLVVISGKGGSCKSTLSTNIAIKLASYFYTKNAHENSKMQFYQPTDFFLETFRIRQRCSSVFFQSENSMGVMNQRLKKIVGDNEKYKKGLENIYTPMIRNDVLATGFSFLKASTCDYFLDTMKKIEDDSSKKLDLLILDPLISFHDGDENSNQIMRKVMDSIVEVSLKAEVTPIVIHHDNKSGNYRGASAIYDCCRSQIKIMEEVRKAHSQSKKMIPTGNFEVIHAKSNNFRKFSSFIMRMNQYMRFEKVEVGLTPEKQEKIKNVETALEKLAGHASSQNELVTEYQKLSGLGITACKSDIDLAVKNTIIDKKPSQVKKGAFEYSFWDGKL